MHQQQQQQTLCDLFSLLVKHLRQQPLIDSSLPVSLEPPVGSSETKVMTKSETKSSSSSSLPTKPNSGFFVQRKKQKTKPTKGSTSVVRKQSHELTELAALLQIRNTIRNAVRIKRSAFS